MATRTRSLLPWAALSLGLHAGALATATLHARASARAANDASPAGLVGETLDVDEATTPDVPEEIASEPAAAPEPAGAQAPSHAAAATRSPGPSAPPAGSPGAPAAASRSARPLFGAVGVRYATDLATTFTRAIPQAASLASLWDAEPFGSAGTADVSLVLDDGGHLVGSEITGAPSAALRKGLERSLVLIRPRAFTARGATTRLRVRARVSRDDVHDGLHGDVFALSGGTFAGDSGTAFFAFPAAGGPGRRVDVDVRLLP